jgi:hypothetical protein
MATWRSSLGIFREVGFWRSAVFLRLELLAGRLRQLPRSAFAFCCANFWHLDVGNLSGQFGNLWDQGNLWVSRLSMTFRVWGESVEELLRNFCVDQPISICTGGQPRGHRSVEGRRLLDTDLWLRWMNVNRLCRNEKYRCYPRSAVSDARGRGRILMTFAANLRKIIGQNAPFGSCRGAVDLPGSRRKHR